MLAAGVLQQIDAGELVKVISFPWLITMEADQVTALRDEHLSRTMHVVNKKYLGGEGGAHLK